jgi:hypothetical protein
MYTLSQLLSLMISYNMLCSVIISICMIDIHSAPAAKVESDVDDDEYGSDNYEQDDYEQEDTAADTATAMNDDTAVADVAITATVADDHDDANDQYVSSPLTDHSETIDNTDDTPAAAAVVAVVEHVESLPLDEKPLHRQQLQSPTAVQQQQSVMLLQSSCEASVFDPSKTVGARYPIANTNTNTNKQPSISTTADASTTTAVSVTAAAPTTAAVVNAEHDAHEQVYDSDAFDNDDFEPDVISNNDDAVAEDEANEESLSLSLSLASDKAVHNNQVSS